MKFSTTIILFAASTLALPTSEDSQAKKVASPYCAPGLFTQAQCCSTDVAGVANLDCATPSKTPTSASDFGAICAKSGKTARCCVLPILGQALLCQNPV